MADEPTQQETTEEEDPLRKAFRERREATRKILAEASGPQAYPVPVEQSGGVVVSDRVPTAEQGSRAADSDAGRERSETTEPIHSSGVLLSEAEGQTPAQTLEDTLPSAEPHEDEPDGLVEPEDEVLPGDAHPQQLDPEDPPDEAPQTTGGQAALDQTGDDPPAAEPPDPDSGSNTFNPPQETEAAQQPAASGGTDYESMTVAELKAEADRRGIDVPSTAVKQDYIDALSK